MSIIHYMTLKSIVYEIERIFSGERRPFCKYVN